jgi:MYXO-CTERM domain-containing protein
MLQVSQSLQSDIGLADVELVHNAVDWSLADTDLLSIRSRTGASALTVEPDQRGKWRIINIIIGAVLLAGVVLFGVLRRRAVEPIIRGS